jgi:hypothetical protein
MSIELVMKRRPDGPEQHVPVSTSPAFERYWLPVARQLNLRLVPQMMDCLFLLEEERQELVRELRAVGDWFAKHARAGSAGPSAVEERILLLIGELDTHNCNEYDLSFC